MKAFYKRATEPELMDLGPAYYTPAEYEECLLMLGKIGRYLRGNRISLRAIATHEPHSILEVGCGGGDFAYLLAKKFPQSKVVGIDIDQAAVDRANHHFSLPNLSFSTKRLEEFEPKSFDIVSTTLVCHHLDDLKLGQFIDASDKNC